LEQHEPSAYTKLVNKTKFSAQETELWEHIIQHMYFPTSEDGLFLQQEGFLDKEIIPADQLDPAQRPINQHWSWDRILRSCYIKQADVLQGFYFLEDRFSEEQLRQHFDFYEPLTVHESSLSPCIHAIQAAQLGYMDKAYALYLRTARLDLDDYNKEVHEGLHITSMAGTWASVVQGFGGMRVSESGLSFQPHLPEAWKGLSFRVLFRGSTLLIAIRSGETRIELTDGPVLSVSVWGRSQKLIPRESAIWTA
jgi:maltose phosphorylase